ncbi:aminopeptidase YwaD [Halanaerobium saccharolyticum]|jgi:aminopeptidase YwaD|uniref:Aminopeptidase YwaD n=1 Tax=Halanaerobium saccharolyticum TaxID=43595 RepID=A0A4R6R5W9_9FIRM|nr:M28 family peptidase [Halanaerobium saccharolyticum]TDP81212.1 aminopeptidase YwaD [Halanaerobium saccharolyticum]
MDKLLYQKTKNYLNYFCKEVKDRSVGSPGNRKATRFFDNTLKDLSWQTDIQKFDAFDWENGGAVLKAASEKFKVFVSPYSLGCNEKAELAAASTIEELANGNFDNKILLLHGDIAKEQLMPKNFVFYNPEEHQKIISLLEKSGVKAIITATDRNAALAGGVYPFPLIEDGDFDIPSVYMTAENGRKLLAQEGKEVSLKSNSKRIAGPGYNVIGIKGKNKSHRIVITAHIDAKKGSPGAIDNATGVTILLILAELLQDYDGNKLIELAAFNGEDYYSVSGQIAYIRANQNNFDNIILNINIDGAAYKIGNTSFSSFDLEASLEKKLEEIIKNYPGIVRGSKWAQGDHSIFLQYGVPAVAISSRWFIDNIETQQITHTEKDNLEIVAPAKIIEIAQALNQFVRKI